MNLLNALLLSGVLFSLGVYGLLTRRNIIGILISIEIILNAAIVNFIAFAHFRGGDPAAASIMALVIIAVSACEMAVALAIVVSMYRKNKSVDIFGLRKLHG